jgi:hypothetical protein
MERLIQYAGVAIGTNIWVCYVNANESFHFESDYQYGHRMDRDHIDPVERNHIFCLTR